MKENHNENNNNTDTDRREDDESDRTQEVGVATATHPHDRQARPAARSSQKGGPSPRGRTPSEILARKQQLLSSASASSSASSTSTSQTSSGLAVDRYSTNELVSPGEAALGAPTASVAAAAAAEAKLESLSKQLIEHQQQQLVADDSLMANNPSGGHQQQQQQQSLANGKSIDDVYILLAKKEKDLQLAAELGKVLLERNDELSKQNEKITEEYSHKLELIEQDRHKLKRKLNLLDGEYENRLIELQTDCNILKNQLEKQQQLTKQVEKEKSKLIDDLVQQNQRLTAELVEATKSEELLSSQLEQVNERIQARQSNRQDHIAQVDGLKEEIQILNQRKQDLERRLKSAQQDKANLKLSLDESSDKLLILEGLLNERDARQADLLMEIGELRDSSSWLSNKLELMISLNERLADSSTTTRDSVDDDHHQVIAGRSMSERERSQLIDHLKELRLRRTSRMKANELMFHAQESRLISGQRRRPPAHRRQRRRPVRTSNGAKSTEGDNDDDDESRDESDAADETPGELLCDIFSLLQKFQLSLQQRKEAIQQRQQQTQVNLTTRQQLSSSSNDDSGISTSEGDSTTDGKHSDAGEWRQLLASLRSLIDEMPCSSCHLMIGERADYERLQKVHARLADELRRQADELLRANSDNIELRAQLEATGERCRTLASDLQQCQSGASREQMVQAAWRARDEAVARKNQAEIGLAKARIESMQVSSQLMEVVQQKGELSQRLAQFEDDIHYITQHSVRAKFTWEEYAEQMRRSTPTSYTGGGGGSGSNNFHSLSYSSINPLINQLLNNFSSSSSSTAAAAAGCQSQSSSLSLSLSPRRRQDHQQEASPGGGSSSTTSSPTSTSLTSKFTSKLNLTRFWNSNSGQQQLQKSPIKTIVEN